MTTAPEKHPTWPPVNVVEVGADPTNSRRVDDGCQGGKPLQEHLVKQGFVAVLQALHHLPLPSMFLGDATALVCVGGESPM